RPAAIVALNDPSPALFYVASNGRIFARLEPRDSHDYPYVTGLSAADLSGEDAFGPGALHRALALLRLVARDSRDIGLALAGVSEVHIDRVAGVTLLPMRPSLPIELGSGDFSLKLARVAHVLREWAGREVEMTGVSCRFDDEVGVRTRPPQPAAPPAPASRRAAKA